MSLEEELVFRWMNDGKSKEEVLSLCKDEWIKENLPLNEKTVSTAIKRYELLQAYKSPDNSVKAVKEKLRELGKKAEVDFAKNIEELRKNNAYITDIRIKQKPNLDVSLTSVCWSAKIVITELIERKATRSYSKREREKFFYQVLH
jgi:histidinol dehydrogenase